MNFKPDINSKIFSELYKIKKELYVTTIPLHMIEVIFSELYFYGFTATGDFC